jgi:hypothetical protein
MESAGGTEALRLQTFAWKELSLTVASDDEETGAEDEIERLVASSKKAQATSLLIKRDTPETYHRQRIVSVANMNEFCHKTNLEIPAYVKQRVVLKDWPDIAWILAYPVLKEDMPKPYPSFTELWRTSKMKSLSDLTKPRYPLRNITYHYLQESPHFDEFANLPALEADTLKNQDYLAGVGDNHLGESIADVVDHPLKHVLACLPQCLAIGGALSYWDKANKRGKLSKDPCEYLEKAHDVADGTVRPWSYAGTYLSFFPLHREDAQLPSANLHIAGASKIWIAITEPGMRKLTQVIGKPILECHTYHRSIFYHPSFLIAHEIPFNVAFQQPGDVILSDTQGAHQGWNNGNNCTLACNYLDFDAMHDIKDAVFHPNIPNVGRWPCVCTVGSRPFIPTEIKTAKKTRLDAPWFDFVNGCNQKGESNVKVSGTMMQWIQKLDEQSQIPPEERKGARNDALLAIWKRAHSTLLEYYTY